MFSNTLPIIQESDCTLLISIITVNSVVYYSTLTNSFDFNKTSCFLLALFFVLLINNKTHHCKKMKFSIKNFFSKCDRIRRKMQISSQLLKKLETLLFFFLQCIILRGVLRTLPNIYNGTFLRKQLKAKGLYLFSQKASA